MIIKKYISYILLIMGLLLTIKNNINTYLINKYENTQLDSYFKDNTNDYIGVLEIDKISLKKGLVNPNSKANNVNENIQILNGSQFPYVNNTNFILASHSGNGINAYFNNINELNLKDSINLYYEKYKYTYEIVSINKVDKTGTITLKRDNTNTITLITCDKEEKNKQLVIIAELKNKEGY